MPSRGLGLRAQGSQSRNGRGIMNSQEDGMKKELVCLDVTQKQGGELLTVATAFSKLVIIRPFLSLTVVWRDFLEYAK